MAACAPLVSTMSHAVEAERQVRIKRKKGMETKTTVADNSDRQGRKKNLNLIKIEFKENI